MHKVDERMSEIINWKRLFQRKIQKLFSSFLIYFTFFRCLFFLALTSLPFSVQVRFRQFSEWTEATQLWCGHHQQCRRNIIFHFHLWKQRCGNTFLPAIRSLCECVWIVSCILYSEVTELVPMSTRSYTIFMKKHTRHTRCERQSRSYRLYKLLPNAIRQPTANMRCTHVRCSASKRRRERNEIRNQCCRKWHPLCTICIDVDGIRSNHLLLMNTTTALYGITIAQANGSIRDVQGIFVNRKFTLRWQIIN